ncbi:glyceraldehyde-3-phosphate dehydrogenase C [Klebsiella michiganensis]|nr:glyceraldehyde-3-phosphate dehydrogenase C [Klebsiella michiganensis]
MATVSYTHLDVYKRQIYDATQLEIAEVGDLQLVKTVSWYDNEYGFVTQLIRVLDKFAK